MNHHSKFLFVLTAVFGLISAANAYSQTAQMPFQSGEKAQIIIHYKWGKKADIGTVNLSLDEKTEAGRKPYFHMRADISTYKFWDTFFKVRDTYESKFYSSDLTPFYAYRNVSEGDYWAKNKYTWSNGGRTLRAIVDKKTRPHRDTTFTEPVVIRDLFNVIFTCRGLDVKKMMSGKVAKYAVAVDKDLLDVRLKYVGRETKKIGELGTFKTIKLAVSVADLHKGSSDASSGNRFSLSTDAVSEAPADDNVFHGEGKIFIWLTDDDNHLPLYFTAPVKIGSINGRVASCSGLKYPLSSKVE